MARAIMAGQAAVCLAAGAFMVVAVLPPLTAPHECLLALQAVDCGAGRGYLVLGRVIGVALLLVGVLLGALAFAVPRAAWVRALAHTFEIVLAVGVLYASFADGPGWPTAVAAVPSAAAASALGRSGVREPATRSPGPAAARSR